MDSWHGLASFVVFSSWTSLQPGGIRVPREQGSEIQTMAFSVDQSES